jgi:hypothetical protein
LSHFGSKYLQIIRAIMSDPSDTSGGDFGGGDDGQIQLIAPSFASGVQSINGNTFSGGFSYTFQINANPGSPDTSLTWNLNGIGTLTQSGFYTFPSLSQGQTASGTLVFTISNNNGQASQTWNYNIVNTNPPFFTSAQPTTLSGNSSTAVVSTTYTFTANRGAPNTGSTITWSINPNNSYVASFTGANDLTRTLTLAFPQGTVVNGSYTVSISNANGSASQSWNFNIVIDTDGGGGGGGGGDGYWALQTNNSIKNTNANGVRTNGITMLNNKIIIHDNKLGYIFDITNALISMAGRPTGYYNDASTQLFYYYNTIIDSDGYISWANLKNVPPLPSVADNNAALALGAIGTVLGAAFGAGITGAVFSERFANWAREFIQFDLPIDQIEVPQTNPDTGDPTQDTSRYSFAKLIQKPFACTTSKFGVYSDLYLNESTDVYVLPQSGFGLSGNKNRFIQTTNGIVKLIDLETKTFYGNLTAGQWEYRSDGVFYQGQNMLNQTTTPINQNRSSIPLSRVQDGAVRGQTTASTSRIGGFLRRGFSAFTNILNTS